MSRIGIYSGTFDPIHVGHVEFALTAMQACQLKKVVFLPEQSPREKDSVTAWSDREAMLKLAIAPYKNLELSHISDTRFTVQYTLPYIVEKYKTSKLVFLMGSDVVKTFAYRWEGLETLLASVELCIGMRTDDTKQSIDSLMNDVNKHYGIKSDYKIIKSPKRWLASTAVRQNKHTINDLDPNVADYIRSQKIYSKG